MAGPEIDFEMFVTAIGHRPYVLLFSRGDWINRQVLVLTVIGFVSGGCGHNASLIHENSHGAVATFPVQSDADILSSVGRRDALRLMQAKCSHGWRIVKEGEIPKVSQTADRLWRGQMGTDRIWGIQFTCEQ